MLPLTILRFRTKYNLIMHKNLYSFFFLFSIIGFSQSENLIDITWVCTSIIIDGNTIQAPSNDEVTYVVLEMINDGNPSTDDFHTNVCNTLSSSDFDVIYNDPEPSFTNSGLGQTLIICDTTENGIFENNYFGFYYSNVNIPLSYTISNIGDVNSLTITAQNGDVANYEEFILNVAENKLEKLNIYPNPATETVYTNNNVNSVEKVEIISMTGKIITSINNPTSTIDIAEIPKGIYFLRFYGTESYTTKRFIKN